MTNVTQTVTAPKTELDFLYEFVDWLDREGKVTPNDIAAFETYLCPNSKAKTELAFIQEIFNWLGREGKVTPDDIAAFDAYLYRKKEAEQIVAADFEGMF